MSFLTETLEEIFTHERSIRNLESTWIASPDEGRGTAQEQVQALKLAFRQSDELSIEEQVLRCVRIVDLAAQLEGPESVDLLLDILDHEEPQVRNEAGEAILDVAFERFKEVARAIERRLERDHDGISMSELPYILLDVKDPDPIPLIARFLKLSDAEAVASAVTALAETGDAGVLKYLRPLENDSREVAEGDAEDEFVAIGDLVRDALADLAG